MLRLLNMPLWSIGLTALPPRLLSSVKITSRHPPLFGIFQHSRKLNSEAINEDSSPIIADPFASLSDELRAILVKNNQRLLKEFNELSHQLAHAVQDGSHKGYLTRWLELKPTGEILLDMEHLKLADEEMESMLEGVISDEDDTDLKELAQLEATEREHHRRELELKLLNTLVPPESFDDLGVTLEVLAGAGGQEAMLFSEELFTMYERFAETCGWDCSVTDMQETDLGGIRSGTLFIQGENVFGKLKFEGGVHRVQRVPHTSKIGKIHTSTASVVVLPIPDQINIELDPRDLKWDTFRASGAGGQHVQKSESAVRVTHLPTGFVSVCQEERSQHKNRKLALERLHTKIAQDQISGQVSSEQQKRKLQAGSRDRNEKIRTYNYPQDRITDHRIHQSWKGIDRFMGPASVGLIEAVEVLQSVSRLERLEERIRSMSEKS